MTLKELNEEYGNLKLTADCLEKAMQKFKGTSNIENHLDYDVLHKARECVVWAIDRFINKDWK